MGLRSKFLVILIIFSVVPLLTFFLVNQKLFDKLGSEIYQIAKVLLLQTTAKELQQSADNYTRNINRELIYIEKHVENCRDEIENTLFRLNTTFSQNTTPWIQEKIAQQIQTCFRKTRIFRNDLISVNFSSVGGFRLSFPVDEKTFSTIYPFQEGISSASDKPIWILPETNSLNTFEKGYITFGLPVHDHNGSMLGHITIDFDIIKLLDAVRPSSQWSPYMKTLLLRVDSPQKTKNDISFVIGTRNLLYDSTDWKAETFSLSQKFETKDAVMALLEGRKYGTQGYVSVPYEGDVSLLSYSKTEIGLGILNILSEREVIYRIARHPGRLSKWLSLDSFLLVSVVVIIMVVIAVYRSRSMLAPFFSIISAFGRLSAGDFSTKLEFNTRDERQMVADAFNRMTLQLEDGIRMRQGLEIAKEVQQFFFPEIDPSISNLDIAAKMIYCEETGGDYIDVLNGKDGTVCIVVGDVTGHGIGAALLMTTVRALIRGRYETVSDLSQIITSVNHDLTADVGESGRFVTLFIIEINPATHELRWVRAGHDPAWLFCNTDYSIVSLSGPGVAMGVDCDIIYSENSRDQLESGDVILIGTDGIWETCDTDGIQFGKHRLEQIVAENLGKTATEISESLMAAVNHFRGDQDQEDDVSLVVIKIPD